MRFVVGAGPIHEGRSPQVGRNASRTRCSPTRRWRITGARVRGATEYADDHSVAGSAPSISRTSTRAVPAMATEYRPHMRRG